MTDENAPDTPIRRKRPWWVRLLRWLLVIFAVLATLVVCVYPVAFGYIATVGGGTSVGAAPDGFNAHTLTAANGDTLAVWYHPPANGAVIILLHGAGGDRAGLRSHARLLTDHDYGVLMLDLRGHGESGGQRNLFAWEGTGDVGAAVAFLESQPDVTAIGGWGISLGGEVLLGAASTYPQIGAIVADGATHRTYPDSRQVSEGRIPVIEQMTWLMYTSVRVFTGDSPPPLLVGSLEDAPDTRYLLIAAEENNIEVAYNENFADILGERAELWIAPGTQHTTAFSDLRDEYEARLLALFDAVLVE